MKTKLLLLFAFALISLFATENANAQIQATGVAIGFAAADDAVVMAEVNYVLDAISISNSPPAGYVFSHFDYPPATTVFENAFDGTFDAVSVGLVWFSGSGGWYWPGEPLGRNDEVGR